MTNLNKALRINWALRACSDSSYDCTEVNANNYNRVQTGRAEVCSSRMPAPAAAATTWG
ncbi:hypothetical protein [Alkalilimnicola ehrlichii]|uniref:hypothetical protein n=1 Tax=Alkalilimnicola ehrlichii TaxID=351052 RepID=UPI0015F26946|nr:hypothetical protein [Alkalilimnicola ehrlichii]